LYTTSYCTLAPFVYQNATLGPIYTEQGPVFWFNFCRMRFFILDPFVQYRPFYLVPFIYNKALCTGFHLYRSRPYILTVFVQIKALYLGSICIGQDIVSWFYCYKHGQDMVSWFHCYRRRPCVLTAFV
jgi:hypothetical protein